MEFGIADSRNHFPHGRLTLFYYVLTKSIINEEKNLSRPEIALIGSYDPLYLRKFQLSIETLEQIAMAASQLVAPIGMAIAVTQGVQSSTVCSLALQVSADTTEGVGFVAAVLAHKVLGPADSMRVFYALGYLYVLLDVIKCLELLNGFGRPDTGSDFRKGFTKFSQSIAGIFAEAHPTEWSGAAAEQYDDANKAQERYVNKLAEADREIADILATQARLVEQLRQGLAGIRQTLVGSIIFLTMLLVVVIGDEIFDNYYEKYILNSEYTPYIPEINYAPQIPVIYNYLLLNFAACASLLATAAALILISVLIGEAQQKCIEINKATCKYKDIVANIAAHLPAGATTAWTLPVPHSPAVNIANFANPTTGASDKRPPLPAATGVAANTSAPALSRSAMQALTFAECMTSSPSHSHWMENYSNHPVRTPTRTSTYRYPSDPSPTAQHNPILEQAVTASGVPMDVAITANPTRWAEPIRPTNTPIAK